MLSPDLSPCLVTPLDVLSVSFVLGGSHIPTELGVFLLFLPSFSSVPFVEGSGSVFHKGPQSECSGFVSQQWPETVCQQISTAVFEEDLIYGCTCVHFI